MKIKTIHYLAALLALGVAVSCTVESDSKPTPGGTGGDAGAAGKSTDTGDAGADSSHAGATGTSGTTNGEGGDAGATPVGPGGGGDANGGAGGDATVAEGSDPCPSADPGNNDRDHATPYALGTDFHGCLQTKTDEDFYSYTVPATPAQGGYVVVGITEVGTTGSINILTQAVADNGEVINAYSSGSGQSTFHWFNAKAGAKFRLVVSYFTGGDKPTAYTMNVGFTGVPDANEPNDTRQTAVALTAGVAKAGYLFAGHEKSTAIADEAWEDWFKVTLPAGAATVSVTDVASDINTMVTLYNALGEELDSKYSVTDGASVVLSTATVKAAGEYSVKVTPFTHPKVSGDGSVVPAYLSHPYSIKVSSP